MEFQQVPLYLHMRTSKRALLLSNFLQLHLRSKFGPLAVLSLTSLAILILLIWSTGLELEGRNSRKGGNGIELGEVESAAVHLCTFSHCQIANNPRYDVL